ncbi:MAG: hypothetical protein JRC87_08905 [Deltaproteobacteria bacterium]|nr:hypothetical protein [Deltaproteobacteria bacterium]MBW2659686.1 hypothetical protein [Deltaproteobacteria bacterium]
MFLLSRFLLLLPLLFLLLSACSSSGEEEKTGDIERATEKVAQEAINYIKTPIEQAKFAKELQESHNQLIEDAVKQQE